MRPFAAVLLLVLTAACSKQGSEVALAVPGSLAGQWKGGTMVADSVGASGASRIYNGPVLTIYTGGVYSFNAAHAMLGTEGMVELINDSTLLFTTAVGSNTSVGYTGIIRGNELELHYSCNAACSSRFVKE